LYKPWGYIPLDIRDFPTIKVISVINFWIAWASGYPISDSQSGFRLYPSMLFKDLKISISKNNGFVFDIGYLLINFTCITFI
jgi:hypothetical protein